MLQRQNPSRHGAPARNELKRVTLNDDVEIEGLLAPFVLRRIDPTDRGFNTKLLQVIGIKAYYAFKAWRENEKLNCEWLAVRTDRLTALERETGFKKQIAGFF